jgi:hypothetical protein
MLIRQSVYPPIKPVAAALAWALLLFPITVAVAFPIAALFPQTWSARGEKVLETPRGKVSVSVYGRGRAWNRTVRDAMVFLPNASSPEVVWFDPERNAFELRHHRLLPATRAGVVQLLGAKSEASADAQTIKAADEILSELESLRKNQWPEDRFNVEMSGTYIFDPDDEFGPFFWLPSYTLAYVPIWIVASLVMARRLFTRHRAAVVTFESKYLEPLESMARET